MGLSGLLWRRLCRPLIMAQPEVRTFASGKIKPPKEIPRHVKKKAKRGADFSNRNFGPHSIFIQAIGAGSRDAGASLYVFSDENRYLFNCAEGTQRLMTENKLKLCQLDNVFVTRMNWANVGGMSGLLLTLKDMGVPSCLLSGPPQLEKFIQGVKSYCGPLNPLNIDVRPYTDPDPYVDETMAVHQVPIFSAQSEKDDWGQPCVISYVCKVHDKKGNFQVVKARELGLPVGTRQIGPLIADLKNGKSITFEGKEIFPGDLLTPTVPGPRFIVVECPSEDFLTPIIENETLKRHQEGNPNAEVALIIHLTPEHILNHSSYRQWMEQFGQETEHLILNESVSSVHNQSAYKIQTQLNLIHPRIFPLLPEPSGQGREETGKRGIKAECLLKYQLRPTMEVQRDMIPNNDLLEYVKEAMELPGFKEAVKDCSILLESDQSADDADPHYPEVVFLGTGSAVPMKTRNVSSTLLRISSTQVLMLDCGEGTFGQLYRHYGEETDDILCHLSVVFVSHIHADHHTGLLRILYERERALKSKGMPFSPVILVGPTVLMTWLNIFHKNCQKLLHNISFIPSQNLVQGKDISCPKTQSLFSSLLEKNELEKFETCYVAHCKNAFGCSVVHQSGWKLVFSGDTMPCEALIKMGKDAKLLIHEATLEDGLEQDALEKAHSTMSQAINVARKMNAEFVILNHFSQRYSRIPLITDEFSKKVGIAFDHMRIRWSDFHILPKLVEPIKTLFAANIVEMEEKRERKRERNQQEVSNSADQSTESTSNKQDLGENEDLSYKRMKFW